MGQLFTKAQIICIWLISLENDQRYTPAIPQIIWMQVSLLHNDSTNLLEIIQSSILVCASASISSSNSHLSQSVVG